LRNHQGNSEDMDSNLDASNLTSNLGASHEFEPNSKKISKNEKR
jgi:hypothetical protein